MELKKKYPRLAALAEDENVEDVIIRSNKVMEESRSVILKNMRVKQEEFTGKFLKDSKLDNATLSEKYIDNSPNEILSSGIMFQEFQALNFKLADQLAYIKNLESKLSDLKLENEKLSGKNLRIKAQHREEIFYITQMYEEKIKGISQPNISGLEVRIEELEKKLKHKGLKSQQKLNEDIGKKDHPKYKSSNNKKPLRQVSNTKINKQKKSKSFSESRICSVKH